MNISANSSLFRACLIDPDSKKILESTHPTSLKLAVLHYEKICREKGSENARIVTELSVTPSNSVKVWFLSKEEAEENELEHLLP